MHRALQAPLAVLHRYIVPPCPPLSSAHLRGVVELGGGAAVVPGLEHHLLNAQLLQVLARDLAVQVVQVRGVVLAVVELKGGLRVEGEEGGQGALGAEPS